MLVDFPECKYGRCSYGVKGPLASTFGAKYPSSEFSRASGPGHQVSGAQTQLGATAEKLEMLRLARINFPGGSGEVIWLPVQKIGSIPKSRLEEEMAAYSSVLAWEIPWTE